MVPCYHKNNAFDPLDLVTTKKLKKGKIAWQSFQKEKIATPFHNTFISENCLNVPFSFVRLNRKKVRYKYHFYRSGLFVLKSRMFTGI